MGVPRTDFEALTAELLGRRSPLERFYGWLALVSFMALSPEFFLVIPLWFSPGWANGWGGGLTIDLVWPAGLSLIAFLFMASAATSFAASLGWLAYRFERVRGHATMVFSIAESLGLLTAIVAASFLFESLHLGALEMWPNGYNR